ncbi:hypothetical protein [Actinomadura sp. GTD37]|uniref:hypothetical protein n=1 Tax=Actinomadura sp. GTD37 TaxID=1778030 RepID=UPI0035BFFCE2
MNRRYDYVGPAEIRDDVRPDNGGRPITSLDDLAAWLNGQRQAEREDPFTFVIDVDETLRVAPQRSEHVACAGGGPVLSAGEILRPSADRPLPRTLSPFRVGFDARPRAGRGGDEG